MSASALAGSGASPHYPRLSGDGARVIYPWLPHSAALGASSTVALRVRNASLPVVGIGAGAASGDEKKQDGDRGPSAGSEEGRIAVGECRVEASVFGHGLPLQAVPVSTTYASLVPYDDGDGRGGIPSFHADFARGREWAAAFLDATVRLPVRWRDLTRDACLALNVFCDGLDGADDRGGGPIRPSGEGGGGGSGASSSKVWGTTLPLFDRTGTLRAGLHKLRLHPDATADGGMGYRSTGDGTPIESFLEGGATPGISQTHGNSRSSADGWVDGGKFNEREEDPMWKASLILHELDRLESPGGASANGGAPGMRTQQQPTANPKSVPWLDTLTRERCLDILSAEGEEDHGENAAVQVQPRRSQQGIRAPISSHHDFPYLIIELPTPPIPILHEEPLYPVEASTHLRGTTGSITANELIKYHSQFQEEEEGEDEGKDGGDGGSGIFVPISPSAMETNQQQQQHLWQSFLHPLVQVLDYEPPVLDDDGHCNPAQDKHRILAHDLLRGLVDPGLKPDGAQRGRLERIVSSPGLHLTTEEKDLLWRFRFSLVDNRRALTKFLLAVDWTVESEVVQAAELLEQWRKRSPIEVTDALKLLGRNVAFRTSLVRSYAIETLSDAPDEELRLYLLQLVQALKYEEDVGGGVSGDAVSDAFSEAGSKSSAKKRASSLSTFLIERAARNVELANFLFWYLRVEMLNPIYEARYREVFMALQKKLSSVRVHDGAILPDGQAPPVESDISLWQLLIHQEKFISGILECQRDSLVVRGKKDAKEGHLRRALEEGGFRDIPHAVPLPSAPDIWVKGVNCSSAKMFKSALYPAVLDFIVDHTRSLDNDGTDSGARRRPSQKEEKQMYKVMIKTGDDLRQDQLVIMMIQLMDRLLKRGTLDLCLRPYSILAMPNNTGLMEFVERSIPVSQILSGNNNSIMAFFQKVAPQEGARHGVKPDVLQTYIRSCAGYCVLTYLLGVGDRHLDNILIQPSGHFFHIDFGFIFGRDPKPLPPAFRLTKEMVDGMGGTDSKEYRQFCSLACQSFNVLRKSAGLVLNLLHLMSDAGIEDLSHNPAADAIGIISKVEERFRLELTDEQAESFFIGLINESLSALAPRVMEMFHQLSVARR